MSLAGLRVLSLESRRSKEMAALIQREGGDPFVAPSVQERALEDPTPALGFLERLESNEFDLLVCMTGSGLAFWRDQVSVHAGIARLSAALHRIVIVSRGPKPLPVLRELGVKAEVVVPEPNTWKEIVKAVAARQERRIAVQEYGRPNPELTGALESLGASVTPFVVYRWTLPEDLEPLREAARKLAERQFDVVLFTSSIQFDHLMWIAAQLNLSDRVKEGLRSSVIVSVGPVMTAALTAAGIGVDVIPVHPKMAALVKAASEQSPTVLATKSLRVGAESWVTDVH